MKCKHCEKKLNARSLAAHPSQCEKAKNVCPLCNHTGDDLNNHIKEVHTPYICWLCDDGLSTVKSLIQHAKEQHGVPYDVTRECLNERDEYQCKACGLLRLTPDDYFNHFAHSHPEFSMKTLDKFKVDGVFCVSKIIHSKILPPKLTNCRKKAYIG
ncbi:hypothetical protein KC887_04670 [Candidatus Kaiserbacteria bacterium]|nr:hypothetical protein [Candidatus Kaiserbacteria bacterium]